MEHRKWFAIYTRPRWEKKVNKLLLEKGIETYCPLNKVRRKWSDRVKLVEEPLFKSYVFVRISESDKTQVRMTSGVVNFVYWLGKLALIKQAEIDRIRRFLREYENVEVQSMELRPNDKVLVTAGALMDQEGRVVKKMGKMVALEIESLGYKLVAYVSMRDIELRNTSMYKKEK